MSALEIGDGKADVSAEWLAQLCAALYAHPSLRRLTLRKMMVNSLPKGGAEAGLQALSYALRDTSVLEVLQLQSCGLESKHIVPLCVELKQTPVRLKELDLSGNKIADQGLIALADVLAHPGVSLEMLDISGNALEEGGVAALARVLSASEGLRTVKLAHYPLPIQDLKTSEKIAMDGQKLTDFDVQFMAEVLGARVTDDGGPPTITSASLGYNNITEKGAAMLAASLSSRKLLILSLNARGNKIGRDGALELVEAVMAGDCPLALLDLSDNGICGLAEDGEGKYSADVVLAICRLLTTEGSALRSLKIGQNQLCGVNWKGRGQYTSEAVEALCTALASPHCALDELRIFGNCWGNKDTLKLASALAEMRSPLRILDMRWNEMGKEACAALLSAATTSCHVEHMPQRLRCGATLNAHGNWVETLQHDENYMYSGSQDMTIRKWRRSDLSCETVLRGHEKGVLSLKLLGERLFAGDRKGEIKLWKVSDGEIGRDRARSSYGT